MKILEYRFKDTGEGWTFDKVSFGKINLFVGDSATGKSRLINTIFNLGRFAASNDFYHGSWEIVFEHLGLTYTWVIKSEKRTDERKPGVVLSEELWKHNGENKEPLVKRDAQAFRFKELETPKLSVNQVSIYLLKEEQVIQPIFKAFSSIARRLFDKDALESAYTLGTIPSEIISVMEKKKNLEVLFNSSLPLSVNLFVLSKYFPDLYDQIIENFKAVFPFIDQAKVKDYREFEPNVPMAGPVPAFAIKERSSEVWIPITDFASGMLKVLLILTDIHILPAGSVYIIEEYENSLGVSAIDFFPQFIMGLEKQIQFIITSHHPYIINAIPIENWYVFHRKGMKVSIKQGKELAGKFGKSKQQAFVQLINDPYFKVGVE